MDFLVSYHLYNKMKKKETPKYNQKGQITQKESSKSNQGEGISQKKKRTKYSKSYLFKMWSRSIFLSM